MKILITALLSALLLWSIPTQATPINNQTSVSESKPVQTVAPEKVAKVKSEVLTKQNAPESEKITQPTPAVTPVAVAQPPSSKELLMQQAGIPRTDWNAVDYIVSHESSWRPTATNTSSGAHGLCQALPASKMASAGSDYMTNPVTQLKWCHQYATNRYNGWWGAFAFWQASRWW